MTMVRKLFANLRNQHAALFAILTVLIMEKDIIYLTLLILILNDGGRARLLLEAIVTSTLPSLSTWNRQVYRILNHSFIHSFIAGWYLFFFLCLWYLIRLLNFIPAYIQSRRTSFYLSLSLRFWELRFQFIEKEKYESEMLSLNVEDHLCHSSLLYN